MKLLEENLGKTFSDMSHSNVFLGQSPKSKEIKVKVNKWDQIKFISFCAVQDERKHEKMKRKLTNWEKAFSNDMTNEDLISNICKYLT